MHSILLKIQRSSLEISVEDLSGVGMFFLVSTVQCAGKFPDCASIVQRGRLKYFEVSNRNYGKTLAPISKTSPLKFGKSFSVGPYQGKFCIMICSQHTDMYVSHLSKHTSKNSGQK